jgi:predicted PurR-regulated permease PerM
MRRRAHSGSALLRRRPRRRGPQAEPPTPLWVRLAWGATFAVVIGALLWVLKPVFAILAASAGFAYILDPWADWLERRGLSREAAIGVIFSTLLTGAALVLLLFVPSFVRQGEEIWARLGPSIRNLDESLAPTLAWISDKTGQDVALDLTDFEDLATGWLAENADKAQEYGTNVVRGLFTQGLGVVNTILNLTLMPVFVFYLLRDWDRMVTAIGELVPPAYRPRVTRVATEVDRRLSAFVRGQITVSAIMAVLYSAGLLLVGIDLAVAVGVLSGALFIVPYLGTAVGVVLASVLALMKFGLGWELLQVAVVFVVVQGIEGYLLTPRIVGEQVGLSPLVVMVALIVGASLMGIWGMLLAIPITAVLSVFAAEWIDLYRQSPVFGAAPAPPEPE